MIFSLHSLSKLHQLQLLYRKHWVIFHALVAYFITIALNRPVFYDRSIDGFVVGLEYITSTPISVWIDQPLTVVQAFRVLVVYPLWLIRDTVFLLPISTLLILCAIYPLVTRALYLDRPPSPWRVVLFYLPCAFSVRAVLVSAGLGYLFLIFFAPKPRKLLYVLSALFVNLSSASVFLWVTASLLNCMRPLPLGKVRWIVLGIMLVSMSISIESKFHYFKTIALDEKMQIMSDENSHELLFPKKLPSIILSFATTVMERNTIAVSLEEWRYKRVVSYLLILALLSWCLIITFHERNTPNNKFTFFVAGLIMFAMEGLGVVALIAPLVIFLCEYYSFPRREIVPA
jgi:hypothetical protein